MLARQARIVTRLANSPPYSCIEVLLHAITFKSLIVALSKGNSVIAGETSQCVVACLTRVVARRTHRPTAVVEVALNTVAVRRVLPVTSDRTSSTA